jgi:PBSX family phage terminase large subunit
MALDIKLTEPQTKAFLSKKKHILCVSGYGAGKTHTCITRALYTLIEHRQSIAMYEPNHNLIKTILIPRLVEALDNIGIKYSINKSDGIIDTSLGKIFLKSLHDYSKIAGFEVIANFCDEMDILPTNNAIEAYHRLCARARLNSNNPKYKGQDVTFNFTSSTPEGYKMCYLLWDTTGREESLPEDERDIIRMSTYSNPYLAKSYISSLEKQYPPQLLQAYLNGIFCNLTSGVVYNVFKRDDHVVEQTSPLKTEDIHIGMDFNIYNMASVIFVERKNSQGETVWLAIDELVKCRDTDDMIDKIKNRFVRNTIYIYPDASGARSQSSSMSRSDHSILRSGGFIVKSNPTNPFVKDRVNSVNNAFDKSKLFISAKCKNLIEALEQQVYDSNGFPEKDGNDHILDAFGYAVSYLCPILTNVARYNYIRHL